jgi:hypothetical protein
MSQSQDNNWREVLLDKSKAVVPELLIPPSQRKFGDTPDITFRSIRIRIGERPIVIDLWQLYHDSDREVPKELEVFQAYEVWMIAYAISAIDEPAFTKVDRLGYRTRFANCPRATIIDLFPQSEFITTTRGELTALADIGVEGDFGTADGAAGILKAFVPQIPRASLAVSAKMQVSARVAAKVVTPHITAIGFGDRGGEWLIKRHQKPLVGDHIFLQTIMLPRDWEEPLVVKTQICAVVRTFGVVPFLLESDWTELTCGPPINKPPLIMQPIADDSPFVLL